MASTGQLVVKSAQGLEVRGRRRLADASAVEALLQALGTVLESLGDNPQGHVISDFDISQNLIAVDQFETLLHALALSGARVQRFRLFGCPTLNDEAMRVLADHFRTIGKERAPEELHLSDCAITTEGFEYLMVAIEETGMYPVMKYGAKAPLYLRLENNYIDQGVIQEKIDVGVLKPLKKQWNVKVPPVEEGVLVNLVVRDLNAGFQQKAGPPPAPEDAPPPKDVQEPWKSSKPQPWTPTWTPKQPGAQGTPRPGGNSWAPATFTGQTGKGGWSRPNIPSAYGAARNAGMTPPSGAVVPPRPRSPFLKPQTHGSVHMANAQSRSRTPYGRIAAAQRGPTPPAGPPPGASELPPPWEEQWSDDYNIPYYWNPETGEALWEKPSK